MPNGLTGSSKVINAHKLLRLRQDGTLGSLFINRKAIIPVGQWLTAEDHPTPGYSHRPGWHCFKFPNAPHLTEKGRIWIEVSIRHYIVVERPENQGGIWYLAQYMKINQPEQLTLII